MYDHIVEPIKFVEKKTLPIEMDGVKDGLYFISNNGVVVNNRQKIIKPMKINTGYYTYRLYSGHPNPGKYKHVLVHRLVMQTFNPIDNPEEMTVNHKDCDKSNNYEYNLEWATQKENNEHKNIVYNKYGSNIYNSKFTKDQLPTIVNEINKGTPYSQILNKIGVEDTENNRDYVGNIKRGKTYKRQLNELKLRKLID